MSFIIFVFLFFIGYIFGTRAEKKHLRSLDEREQHLSHIRIKTTGKKEIISAVRNTKLVYGSVVIGQDYFKWVIFFFVNLFGGRVRTYEKMMERGRREAFIRAKEQVAKINANEIINLRLETATIATNQKSGNGAIEVFAYGTAIKF